MAAGAPDSGSRPLSIGTKMPHTQTRRRIAALSLLFLVAGWAVVPLADARLEARSMHAGVHVEAAGAGACAPAHDHARCVLCLYSAARFAYTRSRATLPAVAIPHAGTEVLLDRCGSSRPSARARPRAPPLT